MENKLENRSIVQTIVDDEEAFKKIDPQKDEALKKILQELSKITPYTPQGTRQRKDRSGAFIISPRAAQKRINRRKMAARSRRLARHK